MVVYMLDLIRLCIFIILYWRSCGLTFFTHIVMHNPLTFSFQRRTSVSILLVRLILYSAQIPEDGLQGPPQNILNVKVSNYVNVSIWFLIIFPLSRCRKMIHVCKCTHNKCISNISILWEKHDVVGFLNTQINYINNVQWWTYSLHKVSSCCVMPA